MEELKTIVLEMLPFVAVLGGVVVIALARKWFKGKDSAALEKIVTEQVLTMLIGEAVEYAEAKAKERREDEGVSTDQEKLLLAIDKVKLLIKETGLLELAEEEIEERISSALGKGEES